MLELISLWTVLMVGQVPATPDCDAVQAQYTQGFEALVHGEDAAALSALDAVVRACPTHPFAPELARLARTRLSRGAPVPPATGPAAAGALADLRHESPTRLARAELAAVQTVHGVVQAALLCDALDCRDGRAVTGALLLGSATGLGASLLAFPDGIRPGQALAINSGSAWGAFYGGMINGLITDDGFDSGSDNTRIMLGMAASTGVGALAAQLWRPSAGQVSMVNSGGLWAGVLSGLVLATADGDEQSFYGTELVAVSAGMAGMGYLASQSPASRGRMLIIDAGGFLGGLTGAAAVYFADRDPEDGLPLGTALGVAAGLGVTTLLTRDFDAPELPGGVALLPQLGRGTGGFSLVGQF